MPRVGFHKVMRDRIAANGGDHMQGTYFTAEDYAALAAEGVPQKQAAKWAENFRARYTTAEARQQELQTPEDEPSKIEKV